MKWSLSQHRRIILTPLAHHRRLLRALILKALLCGLMVTSSANAQEFIPENIKVRWERQIKYIESLLRIEPSVPLHYMRLAQAHSRMGNEGEVLRYTRDAVRLGGHRLAADLLVADFYSEQERFGDALSLYLRVIKSSPQQTHALTQAWLLMQRTRLVNTPVPINQADLERRLNNQGFFISPNQTRPDNEKSRLEVEAGNRLLNRGDVRGAIIAYQTASGADPWSANTYRGLGVAYARDGDYTRALGAYHLFIALAPPGDPDVPRVRQIILDYYRDGN